MINYGFYFYFEWNRVQKRLFLLSKTYLRKIHILKKMKYKNPWKDLKPEK